MGDTFELAPAGVLRSAAWPQGCLEGFGDPELNRLAASGLTNRHNAKLEQAYSAVLKRERAHLWQHTLGDPLFEKALALSSLSARTRGVAASARRNGPRNRALRIVEHTLFRYLSRAVGRTTPHGLWAGVTEVAFGDRTRIDTLAPRCQFTPDLRPFQSLIRGLAERDEYYYRASWCLNPTLRSAADGGWVFHARRKMGGVERRMLDPDRGVALVLAILVDLPPMPLNGLSAEIVNRGSYPVGSRRHLLRLLETLAKGGVLVGGMDLPTGFETVWDALERTVDMLTARERLAWEETTRRLAERCEQLSSAVWTLPPQIFVEHLAECRQRIQELSLRLKLDPVPLPEQVLRCDLHLPWRITLNETRRRTLRDTLSDYDHCWLRGASPAAGMRFATRTDFAQRVGKGLEVGAAAELLAGYPGACSHTWPRSRDVMESSLRGRLQTWEDCLETGSSEVMLAPANRQDYRSTSPVGCLFAGISDSEAFSIRAVSDQPSLVAGRFAGILENDNITEWIRERLRHWSRENGISLAEFRAPFEQTPNMLAGQSLAPLTLDPWNADPDSCSLVGARVRAWGAAGALVLELPGQRHPVTVLSHGGADLQSGDPVARLLLWTGYQESPGYCQRPVDIPVSSETAKPGFAPRIRLSGGALLRNRRTFLAADIENLRQKRGFERFCAWQSLAREMDWPEQLTVSAVDAEPIPLHRDSPMGVETLFKGIDSETPYLVVAEADTGPGLSVPGSGRYQAELSWSFARVD